MDMQNNRRNGLTHTRVTLSQLETSSILLGWGEEEGGREERGGMLSDKIQLLS